MEASTVFVTIDALSLLSLTCTGNITVIETQDIMPSSLEKTGTIVCNPIGSLWIMKSYVESHLGSTQVGRGNHKGPQVIHVHIP